MNSKLINTELTFAQFTDCHLYEDKQALHHGANVYQNLFAVLRALTQLPELDFAVFTGDLTQDHTERSYQNFVEAVSQSQLNIPIYWLAGNHDEIIYMNSYLNAAPFNSAKQIKSNHWQVILLDSKSETPAGEISTQQLNQLNELIDPKKFQLLMMHHHATNVGYFIDHHGLNNQDEFWRHINQYKSIKVIACGHVHNALIRQHTNSKFQVPVITCPATSIQFDQFATTVKNANLPSGFRVYTLYSNGDSLSQIHNVTS